MTAAAPMTHLFFFYQPLSQRPFGKAGPASSLIQSPVPRWSTKRLCCCWADIFALHPPSMPHRHFPVCAKGKLCSSFISLIICANLLTFLAFKHWLRGGNPFWGFGPFKPFTNANVQYWSLSVELLCSVERPSVIVSTKGCPNTSVAIVPNVFPPN